MLACGYQLDSVFGPLSFQNLHSFHWIREEFKKEYIPRCSDRTLPSLASLDIFFDGFDDGHTYPILCYETLEHYTQCQLIRETFDWMSLSSGIILRSSLKLSRIGSVAQSVW
jgi:hypothetical protein